jgi:hypothetical protein
MPWEIIHPPAERVHAAFLSRDALPEPKRPLLKRARHAHEALARRVSVRGQRRVRPHDQQAG